MSLVPKGRSLMCEPGQQPELPVRGILLAAGAAVAATVAVVLVVKLGWLLVVILIVLAMIAVALRQAGAVSVVWWPSEGHAVKAPAELPAAGEGYQAHSPEPVRNEWR